MIPIVSLSSFEMAPRPPAKEHQHFPFKLYDMLEYAADSEHSSAASWIKDGRGFVIHDKEEFLTHLVPMFFNQTKFRSFTRQLNLWGFSRVFGEGVDEHGGAWRHEHFVRGKVDRLYYIVRREIKNVGKLRAKVAEGRRAKKSGKPGQLQGTAGAEVVPSAESADGALSASNIALEKTSSISAPDTSAQPLVPNWKLQAQLQTQTEFPCATATALHLDPVLTPSPPPASAQCRPEKISSINTPDTSAQPLVPNWKFQAQFQTQKEFSCATAQYLDPVSTLSLPPASAQRGFISTAHTSCSANTCQFQLPSPHGNGMGHHEHQFSIQPPPAMCGANYDDNDILVLLSGMIQSDLSSRDDDLSSILSLDEVSEDFTIPVGF